MKRKKTSRATTAMKEMAANFRAAGLSRYNSFGGTRVEADAEKLLAQIPDDTRSITGFMLGDPLPGRSALDKRKCPA